MSLTDTVRAWLTEQEWQIEDEHLDGGDTILQIAPSDGPAPWPVFVEVDEDIGRCAVGSVLPEVPVGRRDAVAIAMTRANNGLQLGRFDLDLDDGDAWFVTAVEFGSPAPDAEVVGRALVRLVGRNLRTVDAYGEALSDVIEGADPHDSIRAAEAD